MAEWVCNNCGKENEVGMPSVPTRYQCECGNVVHIQELDIISQGMPEEIDELWGKSGEIEKEIEKIYEKRVVTEADITYLNELRDGLSKINNKTAEKLLNKLKHNLREGEKEILEEMDKIKKKIDKL